MNSERGQASVEVIALVPLVLAVIAAFAVTAVMLAAKSGADAAAEAGAIAAVNGVQPGRSAAQAVPGWLGAKLAVTVRGRKVTVKLIPRVLPGPLAALAAQEATLRTGAER